MPRLWGWASAETPAPAAVSAGGGTQARLRNTGHNNNNNIHNNHPSSAAAVASPPRRPRLSSRDARDNNHHHRESADHHPFFNSGGTATTTATTTTGITDKSGGSAVSSLVPEDHTPSTASASSSSSPRRRINSRDISRSYSGLYGFPDDLLPLEVNRTTGMASYTSCTLPLVGYLTLLAMMQGCALFVLDFRSSWTLTNALHLVLTLIVVHWLKGSIYDSQGEMSALTMWEQLEAMDGTAPLRRGLLIVPTLLCYAGCHFADYDAELCLWNITLWSVALLAKLPFMNGVRLFGINRTVGIDDEQEADDDNGCGGMMMPSANESNNNNNNNNNNKKRR